MIPKVYKKSNLFYIIVLTIVTIITVGIISKYLSAYTEKDNELNVNGNYASKEFKVDLKNFSPGSSQSFEIDINIKRRKPYIVTLDYNELEAGTLKEFLNVMIKVNGEKICEKSLKELLESDTVITFESIKKATGPIKIEFEYNMPVEVGNEAQNATSKIKIDITVANIR